MLTGVTGRRRASAWLDLDGRSKCKGKPNAGYVSLRELKPQSSVNLRRASKTACPRADTRPGPPATPSTLHTLAGKTRHRWTADSHHYWRLKIIMSDRRSVSRGRSPTPSANPPADNDARSRSQARSVTPRDDSRSRSRSRSRGGNANGTRESRSRSRSRSYSRPPSARPASPDRQPRSAKIVIEKLTKNVNESHLREIFGSYGDIEDLEMPINRQFLTNRGIAYVLYATPAHAESAIAHMHEAQLDGATINVSIVLPRRRFSRSPVPRRPPPNRFGEPHRYREPPPSRPGPERAFGGRGGRGGGGRGPAAYRDDDRSYRPRSYSPKRSPPPRKRRSPSYDSRSPSRSPPPKRRERDYSPPRGGGGGGGRRRSPSYANSVDSRDRSYSRDRGGRRR